MDALALLRQFLFPAGEAQTPRIRAVRITEQGEMRSSPEARWMPFSAKQAIDATHSNSRWEARFSGSRFGFLRS